jgi:hypothetical protein
VHEVGGVAEPGGLEQVAGVGPQHRQLAELVPVALEVAVVDGVEPGERREQPHVGLGDGVAHQVALRRQPLGEGVEPREQRVVGLLVRLLRAGEAAPVDAVVHVLEDPLHHLVHLVAQVLGVEVRSAVAVVRRPLRRQVERDLRVVVGHHLAGRHVDDRRHGDAALVVGEAGEEGLLQPLVAQHGVAPARVEVERPAALVVRRAADGHGQHVLEPEQPPHDDRPVRPRARTRDHQPVAARLDRVAVAAVSSDAGRDVAVVAAELAAGTTYVPGGVGESEVLTGSVSAMWSHLPRVRRQTRG